MKNMRTPHRLALLLSLVALAACNDSSTGPGVEAREPVNMTALGLGSVTNRYTSEVAVVGNTGYTGTFSERTARGNAVMIWDLTPNSPVLLDSILIPNAGTVGDLQISEDKSLLVVANEYSPNGAITLFNITNPRAPQLITRFSTPEISRGVHTVKLARVGGQHYAFLSINPVGATPSRLVIADISTPAQPVQVLSQNMGNPFIHDVFVRDGLLFTALWNDGVTVWDIGGGARNGTPSNPVMLGNLKTVGGRVHNIHWFHNPENGSKRYLFIGEEIYSAPTAGDIHVVDASNFASMREVAFYRVPNAGTHNFAVDEPNGILYAAFYEGGVRALDITGDLENCAAAERAADGRCDLALMKREAGVALSTGGVKIWGVALNNSHLFASDMPSGIWKIDNSALR